jgi:hypothetical protein
MPVRLSASGSFLGRMLMDNILTVKRTFTPAEINSMFDTPLELIAAPGPNKVVMPIAVSITGLTTGHTPWADGGNISIITQGDVSACNIDPSVLTQAVDAITYSLNTGISGHILSDLKNLPWKLTNDTQDYSAGGGSSCEVFVVYQLLSL